MARGHNCTKKTENDRNHLKTYRNESLKDIHIKHTHIHKILRSDRMLRDKSLGSIGFSGCVTGEHEGVVAGGLRYQSCDLYLS